jgi:YfiH family protein
LSQQTVVGGYLLSHPAGAAAVLTSPVLAKAGVPHGFGTRLGGVSTGTFASLNFGLKGGDSPENVRANRECLARTVGFEPERLFRLRQVHGRRVVSVDGASDPEPASSEEADALVTQEPGVALGVGTADCVPVLFADPAAGVVGAAHAGWRGIRSGVLQAIVEDMRARGASSVGLRAAVGPCIGPCCYEVGEEVAEQFEAIEGAVHRDRGPKPHLDLVTAVRERISAAGLAPEAVGSPEGLCTRCQEDLFFSFRRDQARTGHHLSVVVRPGLR